MKFRILIFFLFSYQVAIAQNDTIGYFENHKDIGNPKLAGSAIYDKVTHSYKIKGGGYNIWFNRDEFHYAYKKVTGDFIATANFEFMGDEGNGHRKTGWMLRQSLADDDVHISAESHGDGLTVLQWRSKKGQNMKDPEEEIFYPERATFGVIQLQRTGKKVTMRIGHVGEPLKTVGAHEMPNIKDPVYLGIYICSHDPEKLEEARVWDVHIDKPANKTASKK